MDQKSIIELTNVDFFYEKGKPAEVHALKDINLSINKGEFVSFFGPSGCGKSTMLYMISGIDKPSTGTITINGENVSEFDAQKVALFRQTKLGLIFQNFNLIPSISVLENVGLPMAFLGMTGERRKKQALQLLTRMGIAHLANRLPYELSGGQQQRVGIARALANDPPIILADEPTGNLDSKNAINTLELLKSFAKEGKTVILVTHEAWSLRYVDRVFHMKDGEIIKTEQVQTDASGAIVGGATLVDRAKILTEILLRGYSQEEMKRLEDVLSLRLANTIDKKRMFEELDKPYQQGGVGLWKQKAQSITNEVEKIIQEGIDIKRLYNRMKNNPERSYRDELEALEKWLFEGHNIFLSAYQSESLQECLRERLSNIITPEHFKRILLLPKSENGVGLNTQAGLRIADRLEMLLSMDNPEQVSNAK